MTEFMAGVGRRLGNAYANAVSSQCLVSSAQTIARSTLKRFAGVAAEAATQFVVSSKVWIGEELKQYIAQASYLTSCSFTG
jgi:hypothetical protein